MANPMNDLGEMIFLDRYALKDIKKDTLSVGDTVIVCVDQKTRQREIGTVLEMGGRSDSVKIKLRNGDITEQSWDDVDKPLELKPEECMLRTAKGVAAIETDFERRQIWERNFNWLLDDWRFIPGGRILAMAGTSQQLTAFNCYVIGSPVDSRAGIVKTLSEMMEIMSRGGGVGINLSTLRPQHAYVKGVNGRSSGSVSWGGLYSFVTGLIEQGGSRRGALMLILNVWHPDILNFINVKREAGKITNANISVGVTDDFMEAVAADTDWKLEFPDSSADNYETLWDGDLKAWKAAGRNVILYKTVKARDIWNQIIQSAWASAEPGVFFIERANKESNSHYFSKLISTNPCFTADTRVALADGRGHKTIGELAKIGKDVDVYAVDPSTGKIIVRRMRNPRLTGKKVDVYKVTIEGGHSFKATANHKMIMRNMNEKEVKHLKAGDSLWIGYRGTATYDRAIYKKDVEKQFKYLFIRGCKDAAWKAEHRVLMEHKIKSSIPQGYHVHHKNSNSQDNRLRNLELITAESHRLEHANNMIGANNPMNKVMRDPKKASAYCKNMSKVTAGDLNGRYKTDTSNESIFSCMMDQASELGRQALFYEWKEYARKHGSLSYVVKYRLDQLGFKSQTEMLKDAAKQAGVINNLKSYTQHQANENKAIKQGYKTLWLDGELCVERVCETCKNKFAIAYKQREVSFCSSECGTDYVKGRANQVESERRSRLDEEFEQKRDNMIRQYIDLSTELGRDPLRKEFEQRMKDHGFVWRIGGSARTFQSFSEIKDAASIYNHKIVSVEYVGKEDVFNGTVDEVHNFCIVAGEERIKSLSTIGELFLASPQCGEQPLPANSVCLLGALNLSKFTVGTSMNWDDLGKAIRYAVRFLDNVIDMTPYFMEANEARQKSERRIGMGFMGLAEMLIRLELRYGSDEGNKFLDKLGRFIATESYLMSTEIAEEKGSFPAFDADKLLQSGYAKKLPDKVRKAIREKGLRNVTLLTVAPTGSTGTMVGTSTGVEPYFSWSYFRKSRLGTHEEKIKVAQEWLELNPGKELPPWFVTSMDLSPEDHVRVQATMQRWIDSAISKTCNAPNDYTVEQTRDLYELLYSSGCKGGTIYRDGSRSEQVLNLKEEPKEPAKEVVKEQAKEEKPVAKSRKKSRDRPKMTTGVTVEKDSPLGHVFTTLNVDENNDPVEVFIIAGKTGSDIASMSEALGRTISLMLRIENMSPLDRLSALVDQLEGIGGSNSVGMGKNKIKSMPDSVAKAIQDIMVKIATKGSKEEAEPKEEVHDAQSVIVAHPVKGKRRVQMDICPRCGESALVSEEGCQHCTNCAYSRCG